ncbi:DASS family sodium-coupled anion symporter, partial [Candidatus Bipolaricaulota bacterium]|nr:DASS family sodium-coupled anion symporter [Candidatus Bipolaricaulota bacterium]
MIGNEESEDRYSLRQKIGLILGLTLFLLIIFLPAEIHSPAAKKTLAIAVLMATWWVTEALPIPAVSLLPLALFPALGIMGSSEVASQYGHRLIFLFMGGFLIAVAMQKWDLHKRIALYIIRSIGTGPKQIVLGFMVASGFLSMWISNTATTMMMAAIGLAVVSFLATASEEKAQIKGKLRTNFGVALMLGIAYACSIGGMGTIIGSPPNALLVAFLENNFNQSISFLDWLIVGLPIVIILLPIAWWYLTNISSPIRLNKIPGGEELIKEKIQELGPMGKGEKRVLAVFILTAFLWIIRSFVISPYLPMVGDATIAISMALLLFLIPVNLEKGEFALDWDWAIKIPWGTLILFGGGLALAKGIENSGLAIWLAEKLDRFTHLPVLFFLLVTITLMVSLTNLTSNTGTAAM